MLSQVGHIRYFKLHFVFVISGLPRGLVFLIYDCEVETHPPYLERGSFLQAHAQLGLVGVVREFVLDIKGHAHIRLHGASSLFNVEFVYFLLLNGLGWHGAEVFGSFVDTESAPRPVLVANVLGPQSFLSYSFDIGVHLLQLV